MLNLQSTVDKLNIFIFNLEISEPVQKISNAFNHNPKLPGIILLDETRLVGLISRNNFFQYMSRPYSLELAAKRSISTLLPLMKVEKFLISRNASIIEAAAQSLLRSKELINEPIIVEIETGLYGIIDAHQLLIYQTKIQEYTCELLRQMYRKLSLANQNLEQVNLNLKQANRKLEHLALVDDLTQVGNRRAFNQYLQREWQRGQKQKMSLSVIMFSLDYFREYNYQYGAKSGDSCLQNIAKIITQSLREQENLFARYNGATFAIAVPNSNAVLAASIAEKLRSLIVRLRIEHKNSPISNCLTLSLGVASLLPHPYSSAKTLITIARRALSLAKQSGKNQKIIWNNSQLDNFNESIPLNPEMRKELVSVYSSNKYVGKFI